MKIIEEIQSTESREDSIQLEVILEENASSLTQGKTGRHTENTGGLTTYV